MCVVRAIVDRELHRVDDWKLLAFERMRQIDVAHSWSSGTHETYQSKLRRVHNFASLHGIGLLAPPSLTAPPRDPCIPLMWAMEHYSLAPTTKSHKEDIHGTVNWNTIRHLRSAMSQLHGLSLTSTDPCGTYEDSARRVVRNGVRPTDSSLMQYFAKGISARIGDQSVPSVPLLERHIQEIDRRLDRQYQTARTRSLKRKWALAGFANMVFWLGWLRSNECFNLTWSDVNVTLPQDGPSLDLPVGLGALILALLPETKTSRSHTADVVIAFHTVSGFRPGRWCLRAIWCSGLTLDTAAHCNLRVFTHENGSPWDSYFFRYEILYPILEDLKPDDAYLRIFDDLVLKFWSLHCYRRGARS